MKTGKRILSVLLSVIMVLGVCAAAPFTASAEFYTADGIKWCYEVLEDGRSVRIVYGSEPADPNAGSISGPITIPRSFYLDDGKVYTVTEIDNAFNSTVVYGGITNVTIPDTVKTIGRLSFNKLSNLSSVIINGNSLETIGASAFYGCKNLSSITIPQGVKTIDNYAFYNCESLSSVVIPDNVTTFGTYVFRNCTNLLSAVIGANVPSLTGTFISCGNLESVTFSSNSVTDFSSYTFYGCGSLTSITIPCDFDKNKFEPGSASYINIPETDLNDNPDDDVHTFTVQGTSASGTFSYTHNYGEPVWNWDDVSHPTYTAYCAGCGAEKTGGADSVTSIDTPATTEADGYTTYTATVTLDSQKFTDEYTVIDEGSMLQACKDTFDDYKDGAKGEADSFAEDGDSEEIQALISDAKNEIDTLTYDEGKSLEENKAAVDAILAALEEDINAHREEYTATFVSDGETVKEVKFTIDTKSITDDEPDVPAKEGYEGKWSEYTLAAADITIQAEYTAIEYTAKFVDENGETVEEVKFTVEDESITEPDVPEKAGYVGEWEEYTLGTSDITIKPVYANITSIQIENYEENSETGYKEDKTFTVKADDLPEGAEIHWFVNGEDVGTGESYTVEDPTDDYNIYAEVIDKDGNTLDTTKVQSVKVKNGFFDRLKAFFAELIEKILGKAIADLLTSIC